MIEKEMFSEFYDKIFKRKEYKDFKVDIYDGLFGATLIKEFCFPNELIKSYRFFKHGRMSSKMLFRNRMQFGLEQIWNYDGTREIISYYKQDFVHGIDIEFNYGQNLKGFLINTQ